MTSTNMLICDAIRRNSLFEWPYFPNHRLCQRILEAASLIDLLPESHELRRHKGGQDLMDQLLELGPVSISIITTRQFEARAQAKEARLVGIVTPVFNVHNYITQTIESIVHQDFGMTLSVIVDDGSTDETNEIINAYITEHTNDVAMCYARIPHTGWPSVTRNFALRNLLPNAVRYIAFMDGDDVYASPQSISRLASALDANPLAFAAFGDFERINERGDLLATPKSLRRGLNGKYFWIKSRRLTWKNLAAGNYDVFHFQALLVRTNAPFIPYLRRGEDGAYYRRLFFQSSCTNHGELTGLVQVPEVVFRYRTRDDSLSRGGETRHRRELRREWERPGVPEASLRSMGMPPALVQQKYISSWLAKRWIDEVSWAAVRSNYMLAMKILYRSTRDRRVRKRDLFGKLCYQSARLLRSPRIIGRLFSIFLRK